VMLTPMGRCAHETDVQRHELDLFGALGMCPPAESALDVWVKATAFIVWSAGALYLIIDPADPDTAPGVVIMAACIVRLVWLLRRRHERVVARTQLLLSHTRSPGSDGGGRFSGSFEGSNGQSAASADPRPAVRPG